MVGIAILGEIEKAFHVIGLHKQDCNCVRFLWIHNVDQLVTQCYLKIFRFTQVPFAPPFLFSTTVKHHLEKEGTSLPVEIMRNLYVDNVIVTANSTGEAVCKYYGAKNFFRAAVLNSRQFLPNDSDSTKLFQTTAESEAKTLIWGIKSDEIIYHIDRMEDSSPKKNAKSCIKQQVYSIQSAFCLQLYYRSTAGPEL